MAKTGSPLSCNSLANSCTCSSPLLSWTPGISSNKENGSATHYLDIWNASRQNFLQNTDYLGWDFHVRYEVVKPVSAEKRQRAVSKTLTQSSGLTYSSTFMLAKLSRRWKRQYVRVSIKLHGVISLGDNYSLIFHGFPSSVARAGITSLGI
jgi:hypothetical protein